VNGSKLIDALVERLLNHADIHGLQLNPDKNITGKVIAGLVRNVERHHGLYCPCRIVTGDREADKAIKCPCIHMLEDVENNGQCKCGLFMKKFEGDV